VEFVVGVAVVPGVVVGDKACPGLARLLAEPKPDGAPEDIAPPNSVAFA
jgi:hypothetical protein